MEKVDSEAWKLLDDGSEEAMNDFHTKFSGELSYNNALFPFVRGRRKNFVAVVYEVWQRQVGMV